LTERISPVTTWAQLRINRFPPHHLSQHTGMQHIPGQTRDDRHDAQTQERR
jgi:hypothetical protein